MKRNRLPFVLGLLMLAWIAGGNGALAALEPPPGYWIRYVEHTDSTGQLHAETTAGDFIEHQSNAS